MKLRQRVFLGPISLGPSDISESGFEWPKCKCLVIVVHLVEKLSFSEYSADEVVQVFGVLTDRVDVPSSTPNVAPHRRDGICDQDDPESLPPWGVIRLRQLGVFEKLVEHILEPKGLDDHILPFIEVVLALNTWNRR